MSIEELVQKLEAASEGSREWDVAIHKALGNRATNHDALTEEQRESHFHTFAPPYSTSLDAALSLVPEGWGFKMEVNQGYGIEVTVGHVGVNKFYDMPHAWSDGPTAPLALCIASLKARMENNGD